MINVNILNNLIGGISKQIPLVHSYYTQSPYESWNTKEIQYGSVSFVITRVNTRETTTTFDATIYYGDRLLEDNSNRDSVHSDAATVIQTIVGALNTADDYLEVSYPVGITLFEQDFEDAIAGGWAQLSISTEGMGECFEDDFSVPDIIATSAYYTKEEINQLFPLRTELATIAYTGSFNDLKDKPDLVNQQQYDELLQAVLDATADLAKEINGKVSIGKYDEWVEYTDASLASKIDRQTFDNLYETIETITTNLAVEIKNKVSHEAFNALKDSLKDNITQQQYNELYNAVLDATENLAKQIEQKVSVVAFSTALNELEAKIPDISNLVNSDTFNSAISGLSETLDSKVNSNYFEGWKSVVDDTLDGKASQSQINSLYEAIEVAISNLAVEISTKVSEDNYSIWKSQIEAELSTKATQQAFDNLAVNVITKQNLDSVIDEVLKDYNQLVDNYIKTPEFEAEIKAIVQKIIENSADYYTKSETYNKQEIDYKTAVINTKFGDYYTKSQVDDIIDNIEISGEDVDLSDYYKKSETYSKTEIDATIGNINTILNNVLYTL